MGKEIKLGDKAKCLVSGFVGIVESKIECLNGCLRYGLVESEREGIKNEFRTLEIDSQQVKRIDGGLNKLKKIEKNKTGGPMKFGKLNN